MGIRRGRAAGQSTDLVDNWQSGRLSMDAVKIPQPIDLILQPFELAAQSNPLCPRRQGRKAFCLFSQGRSIRSQAHQCIESSLVRRHGLFQLGHPAIQSSRWVFCRRPLIARTQCHAEVLDDATLAVDTPAIIGNLGPPVEEQRSDLLGIGTVPCIDLCIGRAHPARVRVVPRLVPLIAFSDVNGQAAHGLGNCCQEVLVGPEVIAQVFEAGIPHPLV